MGYVRMSGKPFTAPAFLDAVGRRRKLSQGSMQAIMNDFADGMTTGELAQTYGVSTSLIRTICYHVPRKQDLDKLTNVRQEGQP